MDTSSDFIRPEFLNIIFFQQKNLVIFPYVDLKHLHGLEIFTAGYNVVDLESTALHNLKEILEFESTNSYSQNPTLYFIYNVDKEKVRELMSLEGIRCIINSNENINTLANGSQFIFFNKKNNQFLNYDVLESELDFEQWLINNSEDQEILQENIQKIKIAGSRIFKELNQRVTLENLPIILKEYKKEYWKSILKFTSRYYDINIPDISEINLKPQSDPHDYSDEYSIILSGNRQIGKEFIQLLHDYRSRKVNSAHLELDELYNPQKLYNYLRNHHWKEGIPQDFLTVWSQMKISNYSLTEEDQIEFARILKKLDLEIEPQESHDRLTSEPSSLPEPKAKASKNSDFIVHPPQNEWNRYRAWILERLEDLEHIGTNTVLTFKDRSYLLKEISDLIKISRLLNDTNIHESEHQPVPERLKKEIVAGMRNLKIFDLLELHQIQNKVEFINDFIVTISNLHNNVFGVDNINEERMPEKIKKFNFPTGLKNELLRFNRLRNKFVAHREEISRQERDNLLKYDEKRLYNTYINLLVFLLKEGPVQYLTNECEPSSIAELKQLIFGKHLRESSFSDHEINRILELLK